MSELKPSRGHAVAVAAHLARGTRLKPIRDLCEDQRTVSTGKLEFMADNLANCMKSDAVLIRNLSDYAEAVDGELTAAKARIAELEKALEPFAREFENWNAGALGNDCEITAGPIVDGYEPSCSTCEFNLGDLRRAAALLNKEGT